MQKLFATFNLPTYLPQRMIKYVRKEKTVISFKPLFPCYLFTQQDPPIYKLRDNYLTYINSCGTPIAISESALNEIKVTEQKLIALPPEPKNANIGDTVLILSGPLIGQQGIVAETRGKHLKLTMYSRRFNSCDYIVPRKNTEIVPASLSQRVEQGIDRRGPPAIDRTGGSLSQPGEQGIDRRGPPAIDRTGGSLSQPGEQGIDRTGGSLSQPGEQGIDRRGPPAINRAG
jgi:hypothetical protein